MHTSSFMGPLKSSRSRKSMNSSKLSPTMLLLSVLEFPICKTFWMIGSKSNKVQFCSPWCSTMNRSSWSFDMWFSPFVNIKKTSLRSKGGSPLFKLTFLVKIFNNFKIFFFILSFPLETEPLFWISMSK